MEPTDGTLRIARSPDGQWVGRFLIGPTILLLTPGGRRKKSKRSQKNRPLSQSSRSRGATPAEAEPCVTAIQSSC
jgi:hypothetical protein